MHKRRTASQVASEMIDSALFHRLFQIERYDKPGEAVMALPAADREILSELTDKDLDHRPTDQMILLQTSPIFERRRKCK